MTEVVVAVEVVVEVVRGRNFDMRGEGMKGLHNQIVPPRTEDTIEDDSTIDVVTTIVEDLHVIMRIEEDVVDNNDHQMDHLHSNSSYVVV